MNRRRSLATVEAAVSRLAAGIDAPANRLPTFGRSADAGRPHVEIDDGGRFAYVVVERGEELSRRATEDLDELLEWVFLDVTFSMACDHEVRHRAEGDDVRRVLFRHQVELLARLDPAWGERRKVSVEALLGEDR